MSSLQKFHRRTQSVGPAPFAFTSIGSGDETHGYWLAGAASNKLIFAPGSSETGAPFGSDGVLRGTASTTNGLANTNTLASFGSAAHPAAYYCKTHSLGGYNTWYLPALTELESMIVNKAATPFATAPGNDFNAYFGLHWTSTEIDASQAYRRTFNSSYGQYNGPEPKWAGDRVRPVRRTTV